MPFYNWAESINNIKFALIKIAIRKREIMEIQNISKKLKHLIENLHEIDEIDEISKQN